MKYLLKGGEFNNKGSEAMTLVALKRIINSDKNAEVFLIDYGFPMPYLFSINVSCIYFPNFILKSLLNNYSMNDFLCKVKDFVKFFIPNKKSSFGKRKNIISILKSIDVVIDISGFALSSKWDENNSIEYCDWICLLKKYGAKIYLMPQSFGPFNYNHNGIVEYIKLALSQCEKIYVREKKGKDYLEQIGVKNAILMPDSVLLEKNFDPSFFLSNYSFYNENFNLNSSKKTVLIIPNYRLIDRGNIKLEKLLDFYYFCIDKYADCVFYLVSHAGEDLEICKRIKEKYHCNSRVMFVDHVLASFSYEKLAAQSSFIIASRYHSVVHAYKEYTPAIIIGWADKYNELAQLMMQEEYLVDFNEASEDAITKFDRLYKNYYKERTVLRDRLAEIRKQNDCYSFLKIVD